MSSRKRFVEALGGTLLESAIFAALTTAVIAAVSARGCAFNHGESQASEDDVVQVTAEWKSGGITTVVTTTRDDGESAADFAAKHREAVDAMKIEFPVDDQ